MDAIEAPDDVAVSDAAVPTVAAGEEYRGETAGRWTGSVLAQCGTVIHGSVVLAG